MPVRVYQTYTVHILCMDPYHAHAVLYRLLVRVDVHQLTHDTHLAAALPGLARHHHLLRRKGRGGALPPYPIPARPHTHTHHQHNPIPMAASHLERLKVTKGAKRVEVEVGDR